MSEAFNMLSAVGNVDYSNSVAAVVVTYNRVDKLLQCINCLINQERAVPIVPLIIDNASTDGTREQLLSYIEDEKILYFNTGSNLGGAGGFSYGMDLAARIGFKWQWIMDDDCFPSDTALKELIGFDASLNGDYGFLCSKVLWKDGSICVMNVPRRTMYRNLEYCDNESPERIVMASFVSLFLRTERVVEFGLPIKDFFIWTDDWEFTRRISRSMPCYVVPSSTVCHDSASNIGANIVKSEEGRLNRFEHLYRNDVYLYRREGLSGLLYEFVRLASHSLRILFQSSSKKLTRLSILVRGTVDGFHFNPPIEYPDLGSAE